MESLDDKISQLPPELRKEVMDFIDYLLQKTKRPEGRKLQLTWAGALRDYRDRFTSLELQKKALEWRE